MYVDDLIRTTEAAERLGISVRSVQQLVADGSITSPVRGHVSIHDVEARLAERGKGRQGRAVDQVTAWSAIDLLDAGDTELLTGTQRSRLRATLRAKSDEELIMWLRNRADVQRYSGHSAAERYVREAVRATRDETIGLSGALGVDGYATQDEVDALTARYRLRPNPSGAITLRISGLSGEDLERLVQSPWVAALDAAASSDPRARGVGRRWIAENR